MKATLYLCFLSCIFVFYTPPSHAVNIYYALKNERVNGAYHEVEVWMRADSFGTYHRRGQVYLAFNTAAFGTQPVSFGRVEVNQPDTLQLLAGYFSLSGTSIPKYELVNVNDHSTGDRLTVTWESNFTSVPSPSTSTHNMVDTVFQPLMLIRIRIQNATQPAMLSLDPYLMFTHDGMQTFYQIGPSVFRQYNTGVLNAATLDLVGQATPEGPQLRWSEATAEPYLIERQNADGSFAVIHRANAFDTEFTDRSFQPGENVYRLRQANAEGILRYSAPVRVWMSKASSWGVSFDASAHRLVFDAAPEPTQYWVLDASGRTLARGDHGQSPQSVALAPRQSGLLLVRFRTQSGAEQTNKIWLW